MKSQFELAVHVTWLLSPPKPADELRGRPVHPRVEELRRAMRDYFEGDQSPSTLLEKGAVVQEAIRLLYARDRE